MNICRWGAHQARTKGQPVRVESAPRRPGGPRSMALAPDRDGQRRAPSRSTPVRMSTDSRGREVVRTKCGVLGRRPSIGYGTSCQRRSRTPTAGAPTIGPTTADVPGNRTSARSSDGTDGASSSRTCGGSRTAGGGGAARCDCSRRTAGWRTLRAMSAMPRSPTVSGRCRTATRSSTCACNGGPRSGIPSSPGRPRSRGIFGGFGAPSRAPSARSTPSGPVGPPRLEGPSLGHPRAGSETRLPRRRRVTTTNATGAVDGRTRRCFL